MIVYLTKLRRLLPKPFYILARKLFVAAQSVIPFSARLSLYHYLAKETNPYCLIVQEDCVVQAGMPADLLNQARSRSLLFHSMQPNKLMIIEPDPLSVRTGRHIFSNLKSPRSIVHIEEGAISTKTEELLLEVAGKHQATNKTTEQINTTESASSSNGTSLVKVSGDTLNNYVKKFQCLPTVISLTTNGGEIEVISQYLECTNKETWPRLICIAPPNSSLEREMEPFGYTSLGYDDRGMSFQRKPT